PFPGCGVWVAVAGMAGKENENKFCKSGKGFYLCSPKRKPALRARLARGWPGIRKGADSSGTGGRTPGTAQRPKRERRHRSSSKILIFM
ncbi:hypothetical protein, partial [Parapedobacter soli]|uniref:hypothetical protein n=1 Tax=Parapedobacter soli TaxID=416955 RepID=UPI0021C69EEE